MSTTQEIAQDNLILLATVGSGAHGLALKGTDDRDGSALNRKRFEAPKRSSRRGWNPIDQFWKRVPFTTQEDCAFV